MTMVVWTRGTGRDDARPKISWSASHPLHDRAVSEAEVAGRETHVSAVRPVPVCDLEAPFRPLVEIPRQARGAGDHGSARQEDAVDGHTGTSVTSFHWSARPWVDHNL